MSRELRPGTESPLGAGTRLSRGRFLQISGAGLGAVTVPGIIGGCGAAASRSNTLQYFSMWNEGEPQQKVLQRIIDEYQEANPGITVDVLWGGREVLTTVRSTLFQRDPPDLVDKEGEELLGSLILDGQAESLDGLVSTKIPGEENTVGEAVPEAYLDLLAHEGSHYFLPYIVNSSGIWYGEDQFDRLRVEPAEEWNALFGLNDAIKRQGQTPFTVDGNLPLYNAYWFYWLAERFAGPGAFRAAVGDQTARAWDREPFSDAAREVERFVASGALAQGYQGNSYPQAQTAWAEGDAQMYLNGTWFPSETVGFGVEHRMFEFPRVEEGYDSVEVYLIGWTVPKDAANAEAAKDFMAFALNRQRLQGISDVNITSRPDIPAPEALRDAEMLLNSGRPFHRIYDGIQAVYPGWWEQVFYPLNNELFFGNISAREFISGIKDQSLGFWRRN